MLNLSQHFLCLARCGADVMARTYGGTVVHFAAPGGQGDRFAAAFGRKGLSGSLIAKLSNNSAVAWLDRAVICWGRLLAGFPMDIKLAPVPIKSFDDVLRTEIRCEMQGRLVQVSSNSAFTRAGSPALTVPSLDYWRSQRLATSAPSFERLPNLRNHCWFLTFSFLGY